MSNRKVRIARWMPVLLALALCVAGCAPQAQIESNMNPDYRADLDRIFVVIDTHKIDQATEQIWDGKDEFGGGNAKSDTTCFMKVFLPTLAEYFEGAGVEIKGHAVTGLELSPGLIQAKIEAYAPDAVLHIKESWFAVQRDPGILGLGATEDVTAIDLDCSLTDELYPDQAVWRALLQIQAAPGAWKTMADKLAESLVDKLMLDGLVDPTKTRSRQLEALSEGA